MRFLGVLFLGVCHVSVANAELVNATLNREPTSAPTETKASIDARLALVAVCPEATANCSVPNGTIAQNDALADALDCMLRINISSIPAGPCHDALAQFLNDHLNPMNRDPRIVDPRMMDPRMRPVDPRMMGPVDPRMMDPRMMDPRMQSVDPRVAQMQQMQQMQRMQQMQQMQRMQQMQQAQQMQQMQQRQIDPRLAQMAQMAQMRQMQSQSSQTQSPVLIVSSQRSQQQPGPVPSPLAALMQRMAASSRGSQPQSFRSGPSRSSFPSHGFPQMPWMFSDAQKSSRSRQSDFYDQDRYNSRSRWSHDNDDDDDDSYWRMFHRSSHQQPQYSRGSSHGSYRSSSRNMPSRSYNRPSHSSRSSQSGSSSMMSPMMMMMLPQFMGKSSSEDPMSGLMMITLIKKMTSSSSSSDDYETDDYDYDYSYDSGYDRSASGEDYDYDYTYDDSSSSPSPLSGIIQQMLQAKLMAAAKPNPVKVTLTAVGSDESDVFSGLPAPVLTPPPAATTVNVEIASPADQPGANKGNRPTDQVSYRSGP